MSEMKPYIVRQGDYLDKIAFTEGFDAMEVWADTKNVETRETCQPDLLVPGAVLFVPALSNSPSVFALERENSFGAEVPSVALSLAIHAADGPLRSEQCVVRFANVSTPSTTDDNGNLNVRVPVLVPFVAIDIPSRLVTFECRVGFLDPKTCRSGIRDRLANLGFLELDEDEEAGTRQDIEAALKAFACSYEGTADPPAALGREYGV